ncbi:DUF2336 domain-containing protein [Chenggangzhangella methanolivorans]|uniref:DUF2336 domain-containing protein n=1 Tax=Chenggangzhangella methanolivorans TaxID=1437009 RepID=A0A9E6UID5_9HYPH|nr:DUF2336 domain-containing protein [Chenggangzhangella methanolivorans]QZO00738.1 DUF2336 domain-containing protein [Chenggangzhangella methanolivorans]
MIVERYLDWASSAPAHMRAEAAGALARSYLHGELDAHVREEVEAALTLALDDDHVAVRAALADALAASPDAPPALILSLAQDVPDVADPVLSRSPVLGDLELVDLVALGGSRAQLAISGRRQVSGPLAAAIAEVGDARACERLASNRGAHLTRAAASRIAERHGADGATRDALLTREELGPEIRQRLMRSVAEALSAFVSSRGWLDAGRARRAADEACERGLVVIASDAPDRRAFVLHLAERDLFSPSLALRALLSGDLALFEAALSALSGQDPVRVAGFVRDFEGRGFEALYQRAGFPRSALGAFRGALAAAREVGFAEMGSAALSRRMVERALTACEGADLDVSSLRAMLRRLAAEAAREDARRTLGEPARRVAAAAA